MVAKLETNLDFVNAKIRAIHSRLYEGDRLNDLLRYRSLGELGRVLLGDETTPGAMILERRLVERVAADLAFMWRFLKAPRDRLFIAAAMRLQLENLKVILRSHLAGRRAPLESLPTIPLPEPFRWPKVEARVQMSAQQIVLAIPEPLIRLSVAEALLLYSEKPVLLFIEAALDRTYFGLLAEAFGKLAPDDRREVRPLIDLELEIYNLMFILRARVNHHIDSETTADLAAPAIEGETPPPWVAEAARYETARDILARAPLGFQRLLAETPPSLPDIERRLWQHYYGLADAIYYGSFFTVACAYAFAAIRRMELANLITAVESARYGLSIEETLPRLLRPLR